MTLHDAIGKLQNSLREPPALLGQLRSEIEALQSLLRETRSALTARQTRVRAKAAATGDTDKGNGSAAAPPASGPQVAPGAPGILSIAEAIHTLAWDLQAEDVNVEACEQIAKQASQIYALSHAQAVESERVKGLTDALDGALLRLDGLLETVALEAQYDTFNPVPDDDEPSYEPVAEANPQTATPEQADAPVAETPAPTPARPFEPRDL
ncbi:MAG: hypothetical protein AAFO62_06330 [Pseudomonadota bacterium]